MTSSLDVKYPQDAKARDAWIIAQRPARNRLDPNRPYAFFVEDERSSSGEIVPVATIFLTNRECPWRCAMCDLWKNTLSESVEPGAISRQIEYALERLPPARQIKLYNSGSFFDAQAIPPAEYPRIAALIAHFERTIVECHPALVGLRCYEFRDLLKQPLEVAMGLETAHPGVLEKLNKRMTVEQFSLAAEALQTREIALRVFLLVQPPFMPRDETLEWTRRSLDVAFKCGATATSLIPTRGGNGAMETLAEMGELMTGELRTGEFVRPTLAALEAAMQYGLSLKRGRVFADLWDLRQSAPQCARCWPARIERLQAMNLTQQSPAPIACLQCGGLS